MAHPAHPEAMAPSAPGTTRTAPPVMAAKYPTGGRYLSYTLFGGMSIFFIVIPLQIIRMAFALERGPEAWDALIASFAHPVYVAFHVLALLSFLYTGYRFLLKLFGKSQPPQIGPFPRPPVAVFPPLLFLAWLGATVVLGAVLWGIFP